MQVKMQKSFLLMLAAGILFGSCNIKKKDTFDSDAGVSHSATDNIFKDVSKVINAAADENNLNGKTDGTYDLCATVTVTPPDLTTFPKTVTVDFGSLGCTDQYGVTRKGKLTAVFTGYLHNAGSHVNVTFDNYYVNGYKLEGIYNLANTSPNSNGRTFNDTITNGVVTNLEGKTCTWNATRYSTQTGGFSTIILSDDEYTGGGKSTGVGFNGKTFDATSTNVVLKLNCKYLVSGTSTIYSGSDPEPVIVDFGNGTCDNKYKVSYDIYSTTLQWWY